MHKHSAHGDVVAAAVYSGSAAARSSIASSWHRSLVKFGLDPTVNRRISRVDAKRLNDRQEKMDALLHVAGTEIDRLYRLVGDAGCGLYLTDSGGIVLDQRCKDGDADQFRAMGLEPGAICSEAAEGTNGMGTCIAEERPVVIQREDHFMARSTAFTCIAAPVFGAEGELIASLDISTARADQNRSANLLMADALLQSTRRIEASFFRFAHPKTRVVVADLEGWDGAALFAIDADDIVVGATRAARIAFGLQAGGAFQPRPAGDILGHSHAARDISAVQKSAIMRALTRSSGNVSAAARQLGMGRTTLYRHMKHLGIEK
ncbi:MAG: helix-turn-helix domain-containing protein [Pseudomonadota bacterium]